MGETNANVLVNGNRTLFGFSTGYFSGLTYFFTNASDDLKLPGDFTIDGWWYLEDTNQSAYHTIFELGFGDQDLSASNGILMRNACSNNPNIYINGTIIGATSNAWWGHSTWNYFMLTRANGILTLYANGVPRITYGRSGTINKGGHALYIGRAQHTNGQFWLGNMANFHIIKGTALNRTLVPRTRWHMVVQRVDSTQPPA